jgi:hypothetical protein
MQGQTNTPSPNPFPRPSSFTSSLLRSLSSNHVICSPSAPPARVFVPPPRRTAFVHAPLASLPILPTPLLPLAPRTPSHLLVPPTPAPLNVEKRKLSNVALPPRKRRLLFGSTDMKGIDLESTDADPPSHSPPGSPPCNDDAPEVAHLDDINMQAPASDPPPPSIPAPGIPPYAQPTAPPSIPPGVSDESLGRLEEHKVPLPQASTLQQINATLYADADVFVKARSNPMYPFPSMFVCVWVFLYICQ